MVVARGINWTGRSFVAKQLYEPSPLPPLRLSNKFVVEQNLTRNQYPTRLMIAHGPFTLSDNLDYTPLADLLEMVQKKNPDVLILVYFFVYLIYDFAFQFSFTFFAFVFTFII